MTRMSPTVTTTLLFVGLVLGGGLGIGTLTAPGEWYAGLAKPFFNPPNWIFGPVWTFLYVLIAIAGSRVFSSGRDGRAMKAWWTQLALNFAWSPIFFAAHEIALALVVISGLLVAIIVFIHAARRFDRVAAWLFVPYGMWVAFATLLNLSILVLN